MSNGIMRPSTWSGRVKLGAKIDAIISSKMNLKKIPGLEYYCVKVSRLSLYRDARPFQFTSYMGYIATKRHLKMLPY